MTAQTWEGWNMDESRRNLLKKAAVAGGIVWATPVIQSVTSAASAAGTPQPTTSTSQATTTTSTTSTIPECSPGSTETSRYFIGNSDCGGPDGDVTECPNETGAIAVETACVLKIQVINNSEHFRPATFRVYLDGSSTPTVTDPCVPPVFLFPNNRGPVHDLGPVSAGTHTLLVTAEICPTPSPFLMWEGSLDVTTST